MIFELSPLSLHQVEFRTVRWEVNEQQAAFSPPVAVLGHLPGGVGARPIQEEDRGAIWLGLLGEGVDECHGVARGGVVVNLSVLDFARGEVHTAHQVQACPNAARLAGRHRHRLPDGPPGVGVGLGEPDDRFIEKQQAAQPLDGPFFTASRSALNSAFSCGSA